MAYYELFKKGPTLIEIFVEIRFVIHLFCWFFLVEILDLVYSFASCELRSKFFTYLKLKITTNGHDRLGYDPSYPQQFDLI